MYARRARRSVRTGGDLLDKIDDGTPKACVRNPHESFGELEPIRRGEIVRYELWRRSVGLCTVLSPRVRRSFEEELDRHLKCLRNMLQAACADTVCPLFIFLHLLERDAKRIAEIRLGHTKHHAAHAYTFSHVFVSWVCSVPWHRVLVPAGSSPRKLHHVSGYGKGDDRSLGGSGFLCILVIGVYHCLYRWPKGSPCESGANDK
jgi:hypothetical protein